jgi:membrane protein
MADGCPAMAAALSYYTIFSLPPLLAILMLTVGSFVEPDTVRDLLTTQIGTLLGPGGADQVVQLVRNASRPEISGVAATLGILALVFGATTAFANLQNALNTAWSVAPDPRRGDVGNFLLKRVISLAMVLAIGFLLLVSLAISTVIAAFGDFLAFHAPGWLSARVMTAVDFSTSFVVIGLLFAALFSYVPDAVVRWRDALVGGALTGLLFIAGKAAIGFYVGRSDPGSVYGAAGSLAVALLWLYYNAVILFLGAEFTQVWASRRGAPIIPERGAVKVVRTQEPVT